ncbi:MAG: hydrogenase maturation protease [bacterium]
MSRTLVIGYGNLDRGDDGVAFEVINALRRKLGREPLDDEDTGQAELGSETDTLFLRQLVPELMDTAAEYDELIFVDAHVGENARELEWTPILPELVPSAFTHHVNPATFLALIRALYDRSPAGYLLSIRGHEFDFCRSLSAATERMVGPAVEKILGRLSSEGRARAVGTLGRVDKAAGVSTNHG